MANLKDLIVSGSARILGTLYANLTGNASTATKLQTARTVRTNLGSTSAVSFDGSANITPGVQGTLGVSNGGTGQTSIANIQAGKDANGNVISTTYLKNADQGDWLPNFDLMSVVQTIEFDTSDSNWHTIFTRTNTETAPKDVIDTVYFRITVTGTSINYVTDCAVIFKGQANNYPLTIMNVKPGTSDAAYGGYRYFRLIYPKALNNGYNWAFEIIQNRNNNARHYKVEVFKTNSKFTWTTGTTSIYNSTYHNAAQYGPELTAGYYVNWFNGQVNQSNWASNINGQLSKILNTNLQSGEALLANQFVYVNNNKHYPATNKTLAIEPGYGIQFNVTAYNANVDVGWDRIRQKFRITSLTNIPHATLARGNPCYFRCTMDANGNILSDNYVATSMASGYTWYYVGMAESSSIITIDTTQSFFMTLDANGNLTHINGKTLSAPNVVHTTGNETIAGTKTFTGTIKSTSRDTTVPNNAFSVSTTQASGSFSDLIGLYDTANSRRVATIRGFNTTEKHGILLGANKFTTDSSPAGLEVYYDTSNNLIVTAPTPAASDNSTKVATTAWVQSNAPMISNLANCEVVIESYVSGTSWYRIWSDGWIEQGGFHSFSAANTFEDITLLKPYVDTYYTAMVTGSGTATTIYTYKVGNSTNNTTTVLKVLANNSSAGCKWYTCGRGA